MKFRGSVDARDTMRAEVDDTVQVTMRAAAVANLT
jgi:hypothetical protein